VRVGVMIYFDRNIHYQEDAIAGDNFAAFRKALPRLPSIDDAYEVIEPPGTPKAHTVGLPPILPSTPITPPVPGSQKEYFRQSLALSSDTSSSITPIAQKPVDPAHLLSRLRHTFQRTEQSLYSHLARTPVSSLNDVRRAFLSAARGASRRLLAWQNKHLPPIVKEQLVGKLSIEEPEWWGKGCHPVPGGNIVVREDDWGSIIAFTMRSV
jgi:1-phosphatidylinositol-3-phosphate 5-kinase